MIDTIIIIVLIIMIIITFNKSMKLKVELIIDII